MELKNTKMLSKQIGISLIIPCFNVQCFLDDLFICLNNINYENYEIIFVDDGSTDKTFDLLNSFCKKNSNAKAIKSEHIGLSGVRNVGLQNSNYDYVLFLDADDTIDSNYLIDFAKGSSGNDIVVNSMIVRKNGIEYIINELNNNGELTHYDALKFLISDTKISSFFPNKLFNKKFLAKNYEIITTPYEDVSVMHKIFYNARKIASINKPSYHYLLRSNSLSSTTNFIYQFKANYSRYNFLKEKKLNELVEIQSDNLLRCYAQLIIIDYKNSLYYSKIMKKIFFERSKFMQKKVKYKLILFFYFRPIFNLFILLKKLNNIES